MDTLIQDLKYALRKLRREPGFAAVAVLTLALGIGATTAIFSVADAALLRPFDLPEPDRLVSVFGRDAENPYRSLVYSDWLDLRNGTSTVQGPAAFRGGWDFTVTTGGGGDGSAPGAERLQGALVSSDYFSVLGVRPAAGQFFRAQRSDGEATDAIVLSADLARRRFGSLEDALQQPMSVNGERFRVVGVAPSGFRGVDLQSSPELWLPMSAYGRVATGFFGTFDATDYEAQRSGQRIALWNAVGRLRAGVDLEVARSELETVASRLAAAYPSTNRDLSTNVLPATVAALPPDARGGSTRFLAILMATVGLLLVLACANVASLMLARAARRSAEMGMRIALGAGRSRLVRQLLVESCVLAVLGGGAGVVLALLSLEGLQAFRLPGSVAIARLPVSLDGRVLGFTLGVALLTSLLCGLIPALRSIRSDPANAVKGLSPRAGGPRPGLRHSLVGVQVALCTVLLVGAGLFVRSLDEALATPLGFEPADVATLTLDLGSRDLDPSRATAFYDRLLERVRGVPNVRSASVTSVPFGEEGLGVGQVWVADRGETLQPGRVTLIRASRNHFATLRLPLLAGRGFRPEDVEAGRPVAVVSREFATRVWPGEEPAEADARRLLGRRFNFSGAGNSTISVVGIVGDASQDEVGGAPRLQVYLPLAQHPDAAVGDPFTLHARTEGNPLAVLSPIRDVVRSLDPAVPVYDAGTLGQRVAEALRPQRMGRALLGAFGLVALTLVGLGVYSVSAYEAARRNREMGIRVALGAGRGDLVKLVLGGGMASVAIGLGVGLTIAAGASRGLSSFLYGIEPTDPIAYGLAALVLGGTAGAASVVPARRASRVDPAETLREA